LIFEVAKGELEQLTDFVRKEIGGAYPLEAPLDVKVGEGESWNEAAQ
jgi:DNA polymerase-1